MRNKIAICLLLQAWVPLYAQTSASPSSPDARPAQAVVEKPDEVLARARQTYVEKGASIALPELERALGLFRAAGDRHGEAVALGMIGNCYRQLEDLPKSLEMHRAALAIKQELGDRVEEGKTLNNIGLVYAQMAEYSNAVDYYRRAIAIFHELHEPTFEGAVHNNLGLAQHQMGDFQHSLDEFQGALDLYRGANFDRGLGDAIGNIGLHFLDLGHYSEALKNYKEAYVVSERIKSNTAMSLDLGNIALCYSALGQNDEALRNFDRAEALARDAGLKKEEADWQKGKGSVFVQMGNYDAAVAQFQRALDTYEKAGLRRELVDALGDLGEFHLLVGDVAYAEKDFRRAVAISRAIKHPRGVMQNLVSLGDIELHRNGLNEAVALYRQALANAQEAGEQATLVSSGIHLALTYRRLGQLDAATHAATQAAEVARASGAPTFMAGAEYAQGEVARAREALPEALQHFAAGETALHSASDPELGWRLAFARGQVHDQLKENEEALAAYRQAVQIIEDVRSQLSEERFRSGYIEDKYQVYVAIVQLLMRMDRLDEAFVYTEKLRARSFLDLLNRGAPPARTSAQIQEESALRERIRKLQSSIDQENAKPEPEHERLARDAYSAELAEAERAYQDFLDDLLRSDPAYADLRLERVPAGQEVEKLLTGDTALIEYLIGEKQVSIFVLRADSLHAKAVAVRSIDLRAKVELLRDLIARAQGDDWRIPAQSLYQLLIRPVRQAGWLQGVKRLYVVPHEILHYVPFAVLLSDTTNSARLLIQDYEIGYLPAAATLVYAPMQSGAPESVLALAPARTHLRYAEEEARAVARAFPQHTRLLLGSQATKDKFESLASQYTVLHLATHGFFNKSNPLLSGIALEPDRLSDGRLEVHEILVLRLNARLVTLSACQTALGAGYFSDVPPGDDLVGLTRAFLFAGSSSVLASLWEVNDRSTMELMRGFYQRLGRRDTDKVASLAGIQRQMGRSPGRLSHPYFWGAFVLVGQMK